MNDVVKLLKHAKHIISNKSNWTQHYFAHNAAGHRESALSRQAVCWCSLGALQKSYREIGKDYDYFETATHCLHEAARKLNYTSAPELNDTSTHTNVMRMFNKAMKIAKRIS